MMEENTVLENPKLRPVEALPVTVENQEMFAIRDPKSESDEWVLISPQWLFILGLFTGHNSIRDIQYLYVKKYGTLISTDIIQDIINQIDEKLLLESPRFQQHLQKSKDDYLALPLRPAIYKNKSYPSEPEELDRHIQSFFTAAKGPGPIKTENRLAPPAGLIAPHIDFHRGGPCFAHAYKILAEAQDIDLFILLGTDHDETKNFYSLSSKSYDTPFGIAERDVDFIQQLCRRVDFDLYEDEFNHRREHSIEFQAVFLKWLYQSRSPFTIVPILCGSFLSLILNDEEPSANDQIMGFIQAIRSCLAEYPKKVCIVAGVDFSHVGVQFGAVQGPTQAELTTIAKEDNELIEKIAQREPDQFFQLLAKNKNHHNICGVSAIYTLLSIVTASEGKLLNYDYWHDGKVGSMVSFSSLVFY
ncbi:AmmeMemoRadiSam system protein B [candidate division CSSED10-310 bacterium]|uniref:AmmeMemoRadiSam system protein B n=1 Tax=candidate division CSSED10-310 bacterium TaxID=2855610 RepID=A0ABV6Z562_UNCC1